MSLVYHPAVVTNLMWLCCSIMSQAHSLSGLGHPQNKWPLRHQIVPYLQIYDQIYLDSLAAKASYPFVATNYTSPILHSVELPRLKSSTMCAPTLQPLSTRETATAPPVTLQCTCSASCISEAIHAALACSAGPECVALPLSSSKSACSNRCLTRRKCCVRNRYRMHVIGVTGLEGQITLLHLLLLLCADSTTGSGTAPHGRPSTTSPPSLMSARVSR